MGEFQAADGSVGGEIGQIVLNGVAENPEARIKGVHPKLACRPALRTPAGPPRRTRRWPLAGMVLVAALVAACSGPPSLAGHRSTSASAHRATSSSASSPASVSPSASASPSKSSSGKAKPTPRHSSSSAAATGPVPNLAGDTLTQAKSAIFTAGFHLYSWLYSCYGSPSILEVVRQDPAAGARAALTTRVHMYLQADNCPTPVPNVIGLDQTSAVSAVEQAGFKVHWEYECLGSSNIGAVITQTPKAGTSYPRGDTVSIDLQANNCPTPVPNVIGLDQTSAVSTLEQAGFKVHWEYECLGSSNIGAVITQTPKAGTSYPRGDTVSIDLQANNCS
jgi:PASTA domain